MPDIPPLPPSENSPPTFTSTPPPDALQSSGAVTTTTQSIPDSPRTLHIGTRASALALAQVTLFTSILSTLHPALPTKTVPISVAGDRDKTTNLHTLAQTGKSLWTEELEVLLLKGEIDCIVHSLKDVPTKVVEGCEVKIVGERGERRDCVVFRKRSALEDEDPASATDPHEDSARQEEGGTVTSVEATGKTDDEPSPRKKQKTSAPVSSSSPPQRLADLPPGSVVGTSSIRRSAMIRRRYPSLRIQDVRGNIGTRLRKLDDPALGFDCLILAAAGIQRLGLGDRISEWLNPSGEDEAGASEREGKSMLHAVGQGAVGLEVREGDEWVHGLLEGRDGQRGAVVKRVSWECQAERSLLRTLEGGCSVPVGVSCSWDEEEKVTGAKTTTASSLSSSSSPSDIPNAPAPAPSTQVEAHSSTSAETADTSHPHPTSASSSNPPPPTAPFDPQMQPGTLHIHASVTSVDGTECVAASRKTWVGNDKEADDAGWEMARVLVEGGAGKILANINLNRGMLERGDNA
ncbi:MAG: hypothetical protein Q9182_003074 [Xanthomendoza sp. 2 TL-2023]